MVSPKQPSQRNIGSFEDDNQIDDQDHLAKDLGVKFALGVQRSTNNFEVGDMMNTDLESFNNPGTLNSNAYNLQTHLRNIDSIFEPEPEEHAFTNKNVNQSVIPAHAISASIGLKSKQPSQKRISKTLN